MIKENCYTEPLIESNIYGYVELPEWNLTYAKGNGKEFVPEPACLSSFRLDLLCGVDKIEDMSKYDDDYPVVQPKSEFCILYEIDEYSNTHVAHFIDATKEEVDAAILKAYERYNKDQKLWEQIFEKAKEDFYERRKQ